MKRHSKDNNDLAQQTFSPKVQTRIDIFCSSILDWYKGAKRQYHWRSENASIYERVIAEILLQRTRADIVDKYFPTFVRRFPSWHELATTSEDELSHYLYSMGLWRQKARNIRKLACALDKQGGILPDSYPEIRILPGIGQYIANAISLFVLGEPRPLIDVNMARVLERYFGPRKIIDIRDDPYLQSLASRIVVSSGKYK